MYILLKKSRHPIPHPHPHPRSEAYYTNVKKNNEEKSQKNGIQLFEFQSFKTCWKTIWFWSNYVRTKS